MTAPEIVNKAFYDAGEREFTFLRVQDVEPIIDRNKRLQGEAQRSDGFRHIGTIPNILLEKWLHEELDRGNIGLRIGSEEFDRLIATKLSDPDYAFLRTDGARLSIGYGDA